MGGKQGGCSCQHPKVACLFATNQPGRPGTHVADDTHSQLAQLPVANKDDGAGRRVLGRRLAEHRDVGVGLHAGTQEGHHLRQGTLALRFQAQDGLALELELPQRGVQQRSGCVVWSCHRLSVWLPVTHVLLVVLSVVVLLLFLSTLVPQYASDTGKGWTDQTVRARRAQDDTISILRSL